MTIRAPDGAIGAPYGSIRSPLGRASFIYFIVGWGPGYPQEYRTAARLT